MNHSDLQDDIDNINLYDRFIIILIKRAIIFSYTTILYINFKSERLYSFIRPIDDNYSLYGQLSDYLSLFLIIPLKIGAYHPTK